MIALFIFAAATLTPECAGEPVLYEKLGDIVPNEEAARDLAATYIVSHYGKQSLAAQLPLSAKADDDVWIVKGTRTCPPNYTCLGGVSEVRLCRKNGRVLKLVTGR